MFSNQVGSLPSVSIAKPDPGCQPPVGVWAGFSPTNRARGDDEEARLRVGRLGRDIEGRPSPVAIEQRTRSGLGAWVFKWCGSLLAAVPVRFRRAECG